MSEPVEAGSMLAKDGRIDLEKGRYEVGTFRWHEGRLKFAGEIERGTQDARKGDASHTARIGNLTIADGCPQHEEARRCQ